MLFYVQIRDLTRKMVPNIGGGVFVNSSTSKHVVYTLQVTYIVFTTHSDIVDSDTLHCGTITYRPPSLYINPRVEQ